MAEENNNTTATKKTKPKEPTFTQEQVQKIVEEAVAKALAQQQPQTVVVTQPQKEENVTLLYMGAVAKGSTVLLGTEQNRGLGEIQGCGGTRTYLRSTFFENLSEPVLRRLKDRRLIVISGLTDEERDRYDLNYTDGELVSKDVYYKLFSWDDDKIFEIFSKACYRHKQIIAMLFMDEYQKGNNRISRELVQRLNNESKKTDKDGMFRQILKDMQRAFDEDIDQ